MALPPIKNPRNAGRKVGFVKEDAEKARQIIIKKLDLPNAEGSFSKIVNKAIELAEAGDPTAREWISERSFGKVVNPIDIDINKTTINIDVKAIEEGRKVIEQFIALNPGE
jgi:hypothetical protein